jgi:hypothetical protein
MTLLLVKHEGRFIRSASGMFVRGPFDKERCCNDPEWDPRCCCDRAECCCESFAGTSIPPVFLLGTIVSANPEIDGHEFTLILGSPSVTQCIVYNNVVDEVNCGSFGLALQWQLWCNVDNDGNCTGVTLSMVPGSSACAPNSFEITAEGGCLCDPLYLEFHGFSLTESEFGPPGACDCGEFSVIVTIKP